MTKPSHFQFRLSNLLKSQGRTVLPVRSSDYPVDFIAFKNGKARAYRCKFHGKVYEAEMQKLRMFAEQSGIETFIAKENGGREIYFKRVHSKVG
jgi:Holliday junction resolvase